MDVGAVIFVYGLLALVGIVALFWLGLMFVASHLSEPVDQSFSRLRRRLSPLAITGAWAAATLAMAGSLYFSEIAHYTPCTLCWYQRIAMYPLVLILAIAAIRRDIGIRRYAIPLAAVGAVDLQLSLLAGVVPADRYRRLHRGHPLHAGLVPRVRIRQPAAAGTRCVRACHRATAHPAAQARSR